MDERLRWSYTDRKLACLLREDARRMPRHCLTLDLKDDETAISEYKRYHVKIWPEVKQSLFDAGVVKMEIYLLGTRMFMIMDVDDSFSLSAKAAKDLDRRYIGIEVNPQYCEMAELRISQDSLCFPAQRHGEQK